MLKELDLSLDFPASLKKNHKHHLSLQDLEPLDEKIGFMQEGLGLLLESDVGAAAFRFKSSKTGFGAERSRNMSSQELTLSYLCDNPNMGFQEKEIPNKDFLVSLEKGSYKGKEVVLENSLGDDRWVERDFFHMNEDRGSKRVISAISEEIVEEKTEKKAKLETLDLSLSLPDVSLSLPSSNPVANCENTDPRIHSMVGCLKRTQSIQSLALSNSDDFTGVSLSCSYSHQFSHNPSCSLTRNSTENYEYSVGSRRRESDQIWYCGEGTNGSVHSRFKPIGDSITLSNNGGTPLMAGQAVKQDTNNSHYRTNGSENISFFPSELPAIQRKDSQSVDSRGIDSEQRKVADNGFTNSDSRRGFGVMRPEEVLREIVSGSISITAQVLRALPLDVMEDAKEYLKNLNTMPEKREELTALQRRLELRSDLTFEKLSSAHKFQLDVLVTAKTGNVNYISGKPRLPTTELIEIFLLSRCQNVNCRSSLPVDDCDCKICSTTKGFCSACMCPICMSFDCASNTCSWVGCDVCSHWCHAVCGLKMNLIRPGPSLKGGSATAEMHFHCMGCSHASEMFGFVKDVFLCCAKNWSLETLIKELDCSRKIFEGSVDLKGKEVCNKAEEMLAKLDKKLISPSDACDNLLQFFKYGISELSSMSGSSKDAIQATPRTDVHLPPPTSTPPRCCKTNDSIAKTDTIHRSTQQSIVSKALASGQTFEPEVKFGLPKKDEFDSVESIVRIKEAEARMFQSRADDARREAEGFRQLVLVKSKKLEEEYAGRLAKLRLQETEDRQRKKLEELKVLENSHCDYYKMKLRMEAEIAGLLERVEATKQLRV